jgi:Multicopper oxidase
MKTKTTILSITILIMVIIISTSFTSKKKFSIDGAWSIVEVQTVKPDGKKTSKFPKESLAIFAGKHYSFCWTSHSSASRNWQLADSVKVNRFNQSIINTGTFEFKDSILSTKAKFSMSMMFTNGIAKFKCTKIGDTLVLKGLSVVSSDNIAHPAYANGTHFVSKLVRVKN